MRLDGESFYGLSDHYREPDYVYMPQWRREEEYIRWRKKGGCEELQSILSKEPELELVVRCLMAMGQDSAGIEIYLWRKLLRGELRKEYKEAIPRITARILMEEGFYLLLREIYFGFVLPVTAAMDAGEIESALGICRRKMEEMKMQYVG